MAFVQAYKIRAHSKTQSSSQHCKQCKTLLLLCQNGLYYRVHSFETRRVGIRPWMGLDVWPHIRRPGRESTACHGGCAVGPDSTSLYRTQIITLTLTEPKLTNSHVCLFFCINLKWNAIKPGYKQTAPSPTSDHRYGTHHHTMRNVSDA